MSLEDLLRDAGSALGRELDKLFGKPEDLPPSAIAGETPPASGSSVEAGPESAQDGDSGTPAGDSPSDSEPPPPVTAPQSDA